MTRPDRIQARIEWRTQFLAERRTGIGGSDAAALLGVDDRKDRLDVWRRLSGLAPEDDLSDVKAIRRGVRLELACLDEYEEIHGADLAVSPPMARHRDLPFLLAHADALRADDSQVGVEAKTASGAVSDQFGPEGTDEIPPRYIAQCQHYMGVYDAPAWDVVVLLGGRAFEFRFYRVHRNDRIIRAIEGAAVDLWTHHVETGIAPEPTNGASAARHATALYAADVEPLLSVEGDPAIRDRLIEFREAKAAEKAAKDRAQDAGDWLRSIIGPAAGIEMPGVGRVTWKASKNGKRSLRATWAEEEA